MDDIDKIKKEESYADWIRYERELSNIVQLKQSQASLKRQLELLRPFANKLGLYDAADYLKQINDKK